MFVTLSITVLLLAIKSFAKIVILTYIPDKSCIFYD